MTDSELELVRAYMASHIFVKLVQKTRGYTISRTEFVEELKHHTKTRGSTKITAKRKARTGDSGSKGNKTGTLARRIWKSFAEAGLIGRTDSYLYVRNYEKMIELAEKSVCKCEL